jgi:rhodanese-related sulfurtransferase
MTKTTIDRDELYDKIVRGDLFFLFEVLPLGYWKRHHLPGARHMPPNAALETVEGVVSDRDAEIVLYCWDDECPSSGWAQHELREAGYRHVREYVDGKTDWIRAGLPMSRE